jgi:methylated-DNA-protein-cysteine methyltransferase-like protein
MNTNCRNKVYELVKKIPKGKVATYGMIAKKLGLKTPRIVGKYLHENPDAKNIPCHRVVFSDGSLSKNYAFGKLEGQYKKLVEEGVCFSDKKVILDRCLIEDFI